MTFSEIFLGRTKSSIIIAQKYVSQTRACPRLVNLKNLKSVVVDIMFRN